MNQKDIDTAYPIPSGPQTPRRWGLNISSVLTPSLLVGYEQPAQVGTCLAKLNQRPNTSPTNTKFSTFLAQQNKVASTRAQGSTETVVLKLEFPRHLQELLLILLNSLLKMDKQ